MYVVPNTAVDISYEWFWYQNNSTNVLLLNELSISHYELIFADICKEGWRLSKQWLYDWQRPLHCLDGEAWSFGGGNPVTEKRASLVSEPSRSVNSLPALVREEGWRRQTTSQFGGVAIVIHDILTTVNFSGFVKWYYNFFVFCFALTQYTICTHLNPELKKIYACKSITIDTPVIMVILSSWISTYKSEYLYKR